MFKDNEFLKILLGVFGVPDFAFDFADPVVFMYAVIFSEHLVVLVLSVVIWGAAKFFSSDPGGRVSSKMRGGGMGKGDIMTHQYSDISSMSGGFKTEKKTSLFGVVFKGFVLPVLVIYVAISASIYMVYGQIMDSKEDQLRLLEALLFASSEPLGVAQLSAHMPEDTDFKSLLEELQAHYEGRGVHLINIENKWAFRTAPDLADYLSVERQVHKKLSRAAMETLSIIAYHQPVTRAEIENIRGVSTHKGTLDVLIEMGWVKPGRRRETLGRPLTWVTTSDFLDHFSLESLTDLPGMDEMKASGLLDRRPAIETIHQDDLFAVGAGSGQEDDEGLEEDVAEDDFYIDEEVEA